MTPSDGRHGVSMLVPGVFGLVALMGYFSLALNGICFSQLRFLSDAELFDSATAYARQRHSAMDSSGRQVPFLSERLSPDCCHVDRSLQGRSLTDLFCPNYALVTVSLPWADGSRRAMETTVMVTACGHAVNHVGFEARAL